MQIDTISTVFQNEVEFVNKIYPLEKNDVSLHCLKYVIEESSASRFDILIVLAWKRK